VKNFYIKALPTLACFVRLSNLKAQICDSLLFPNAAALFHSFGSKVEYFIPSRQENSYE